MDGKYKIYELSDWETKSWLKVAPERGGMVIGYGFDGQELLFLNNDTFHDETANVRGGIPILFPISGQLENGEYDWNSKTYKMKNHGFARNHAWEVVGTSKKNGVSLTICLKSDESTKNSYPFEFEVVFTYTLKDGVVTIDQNYTNKSDSEMPMYPGFHPYFKTAEKNISYTTDARKYFDYNDLKEKNIHEGLDLKGKKEALVLLDSVEKQINFELPELQSTVKLSYGEEFKYVYLWTEQGQEFICVEPWMARTNELNRKEELYYIKPEESLRTFLTISVTGQQV